MSFGHAVYEVARKEVLQHIRTKRLLVIGILFLLSIALITVLLPLLAENVFGGEAYDTDAEASPQSQVFGQYIGVGGFLGGVFFIQLLAITLTADSVTSEWNQRTIFLLLSKPVSREAFVTGKFLGSLATVAGTLVAFAVVDYLVLTAILPGVPAGIEVLRFFGALGILILGAAAYSAMALFFSSVTRSSVVAFILALGMWIVLFPIMSFIGNILYSIDISKDPSVVITDLKYDIWNYLSPGASMRSALDVLLAGEGVGFGAVPAHTAWAIAALLGWTALFAGAALLIVRRRDFE